jgi:hypothetical protein
MLGGIVREAAAGDATDDTCRCGTVYKPIRNRISPGWGNSQYPAVSYPLRVGGGMKPGLSSLKSLKRLPLTLAAACLGVGGIGLAVTLHRPVALSPFSPTEPSAVAVKPPPSALVEPEPFSLVIEVPEAPVSETIEEPQFVAAPRPIAPIAQQPPAVQQVPVPSPAPAPAPAPAPDPGPGASAADNGPVTALGPSVKRPPTPATVPDTVGGGTPEPEAPGPTPVPTDPPAEPGTPEPNDPPDTKGNGKGKALGLENGNGPKPASEKQAHQKPDDDEKNGPSASKK